MQAAPIPLRTVTEHVAHWIRQRLIQGELLPGARLREARIARELQTSRAPVREAMAQLAREGLVTKRPNQSPRIVELTESRLREVADLRGVLEGYGASLAIRRLDEGGLRALGGILRTMRRAAAEGEFARMVELDYAFHDVVMRSAGHQLLYETWSRMGDRVRLLVSGTNLMDRDLRGTLRLHERILAALRARDGTRAQRLMGAHTDAFFERFVARLASGGAGPAKPRAQGTAHRA